VLNTACSFSKLDIILARPIFERGGDNTVEMEKLSDPSGLADAVGELGRRTADRSMDARTRE
jgi:hypothetical protein